MVTFIRQCARGRTFLGLFKEIKQQQRSYPAPPKRFYKKTGIIYSDGTYEVTLDHRKLKTPKGNVMKLDKEMLALAVAAEWDAQKGEIQQSTMHITSLCNTALENPNNITKPEAVQTLLNYLENDAILFFSHEEEMHALQQKEWDPVIKWFCERFKVSIQPTRDLGGVEIPVTTKEIIRKHLLSYDLASMHGFLLAVECLKSLILTICCIDHKLNVTQAVLLSRLEEEYQTGHWGRVEWAHDIAQADLQARVAAAVMFVHINSMSEETKTLLASKFR
ncbi:ATP synthase mitochondrial F1 complex assembly factor [Nesidiocoris tenuis]|uniref:ATP synthase mitochondrial F1 complex assembly factor n=1 Tax=Nesidiocoris tenuis TaxID=355587 RepID=A0ABN7ABI8_9HEMI|nr:ATP synthase mitochondrial F1 complex assembly factor [Nesidiocoris tenuis]